jgi:hypothetical protein
MTSSKAASRRRRRDREPRTEPLPQLRTAGYDATTITFAGASDIGLPDGAYPPHRCPRCQKGNHCQAATVNCDCPCTGAALLSAADVTAADVTAAQAPPRAAGYAATTGPMRALGRAAVSIGDALTRDDHWGPKLTPLPCGHCGTPPYVPADILERANIIGHVNWLALRAGWIVDNDWIWTCPACQQTDAWKARQGQVALRQPRSDAPAPGCEWHDHGRRGVPCTCPHSYCDRHDMLPVPGVPVHEYRCTCPGALLAVDVMLASEDHLGSGRGRHRTVTR